MSTKSSRAISQPSFSGGSAFIWNTTEFLFRIEERNVIKESFIKKATNKKLGGVSGSQGKFIYRFLGFFKNKVTEVF